MDGWNLDEKKLKAEFDRKFPNYNKTRKCVICGETFASGKPRSVCLGCAMKNGLFHEAPKREVKESWWTARRVQVAATLMAMATALTVGIVSHNLACALLAVVISLIILFNRK